jgi:serine/threonine protein phosphatase PrpC
MAATLVGGVVQPSANGRGLEVFALRVGDGLIERIENLDTEGGISSLLAMDSQETEISASLSPGRLGENSLVSPETILPSIGAGELLLVSSDGLTRGHNGSVSQKLREITGSSRIGLHNDDQSAALTILQKAADQADDSFKENQQIHLFNDNLSLIVITSKLGKRRGGGVG